MKVYTFFTDSHRPLLDIFIKHFPFSIDHELVVKWLPQDCPSACFGAHGWNETMRRKVEFVQQSFSEVPEGAWFLHSDCDVVLFEGWDAILQANNNAVNYDMLIQNDHMTGMCAGFFFCKNNERTRRLWRLVSDNLSDYANDQVALNYFLNLEKDLKYLPLSCEYFTYGVLQAGHWKGQSFTIPQVDRLRMVHANYTVGIDNKIELLRYVINQRAVRLSTPISS